MKKYIKVSNSIVTEIVVSSEMIDNLQEINYFSRIKVGDNINTFDEKSEKIYDIEIVNEETDEIIKWNKLDEFPVDFVELTEELSQIREIKLKQEKYKKNIANMLNEKAKELGFDSLYNIGIYQTTEDNPLKASSEKLGAYAGNVWATAMGIEQQIKAGQMAMPETWEELLAMLPKWID